MHLINGAPERGRILFAHGAGAPMDSEFMNVVASGLAARGFQVVRFEFPYMQARREDGRKRPPNPMPRLLAAFTEQAAELDDSVPLWLAGKSMGGRVATMVLEETQAKGALVFGYPFHAAGRPEKPRIEHLKSIERPVHIFQGTRDPMGSRERVEAYELSGAVELHWCEDGDHDLKPRKASGLSQLQHLETAFDTVADICTG
ncbi:MAG: alpha/beta fold hydrolase [Oceanospirillaceae bacterium]|nr:alpha/beta fold hydrolase [Oceanospirillaceae bacterium]